MANKQFYDSLDKKDQELIQKASKEAFDYIIDYQKGLADQELAKIMKAKPEMTVTVLTEEERKPFKEAATVVEEKFIEMTGESGKKILAQMKKDLEAISK